MEYRDRAIAAVQAAEQKLRAELRPIILDAIAADAYADAASIARIAGALSNLLRQVGSDTYAIESELPTLEEIIQADRPNPTSTSSEGPAALQTPNLRGKSRRDQYPIFWKDGDRLVKVA